jgi:hypothetical protein
MKTLFMVVTALIAIALPAAAQDGPPPPPPDMEAMMQKMMEAGSPSRNHKILDPYVGYWNTESSFWMDGPDKPPMMNRGSASFIWILGGRFLRMEYKGTFMGTEMAGFGYYGYDNMQKKYTMLWMDNTSTAFFPASGALDEKSMTLTLTGPMDDPATGEMGKTIRYVIGIPQKDRFVFEMYDMSIPGPNKKTGEIVYTRAPQHH